MTLTAWCGDDVVPWEVWWGVGEGWRGGVWFCPAAAATAAVVLQPWLLDVFHMSFRSHTALEGLIRQIHCLENCGTKGEKGKNLGNGEVERTQHDVSCLLEIL